MDATGDARSDALWAVKERMTGEERAKFLDRMTGERNPGLRGAQVDDILDMLWEGDAYLGVLEPFYEREERGLYAAAADSDDARWNLSYAAIAAVVLLELEERASTPPQTEPPPEMRPLVARLAGLGEDPVTHTGEPDGR